MNTHHIRRLPVVDGNGKLVGIVSRRDLLSVFLRPDDDIAHDVRRVLDELPLTNPADVIVTVRHGVVTLAWTARIRNRNGIRTSSRSRSGWSGTSTEWLTW